MTLTIRISEAGSVEIPAEIREANGWTAGTELELFANGSELVLRPRASGSASREDISPRITIAEFLARVPKYEGPPVTLEMMDDAVLEEARRRWYVKGG